VGASIGLLYGRYSYGIGPSESGVHTGEIGEIGNGIIAGLSAVLLGMGFLGIDKFLGFSTSCGVRLSSIIVLIHVLFKIKYGPQTWFVNDK